MARPDWRATMPRPRRPAWLPAVLLAVGGTLLTLAVAAWIAWQPARSPTVVVDVPATMVSPPANASAEPPTDLAARDGAGGSAAGERTGTDVASAPERRARVESDEAAAASASAAGADEQGAAERSGQQPAAEHRLAGNGAGDGTEDAAGAVDGAGDGAGEGAAERGDRQVDVAAVVAAERARGGPYEEPPEGATGDGAGEAAEAADEPFIEVPLLVTRGSNLRARPSVASPKLMWVASGSGALLLDPEPVRGYYRVSTGEREGWIWHINVEPADLAPSDDEQSGGSTGPDAGSPEPDAPGADAPAAPAPAGEAPAPAEAPGDAAGSPQPADRPAAGTAR